MNSGNSTHERYVRYLPWLFTISFILITFLPRSLDDTMFMDGLAYASIARNMALGIGSFWQPFFANSFWLPYDNGPFFFGHPPLQFGLQSILFRIMGDSIAVENIYNLIVLIISVFLIVKIWRKLFQETPDRAKYAWLPVLCWYAIVTVYYSIPNNFLDSTMAIFCLLSCYFQLSFFKSKTFDLTKSFIFPVLAGICIVLACLTKGPVGLYPLAFSIIYVVVYDHSIAKAGVKVTAIVLGTFAAVFGLVLLYQPAYVFLKTYFQGQVVQALLQKREKAGEGLMGHFYLVKELLRNVYPHLAMLTGLYFISASYNIKTSISKETARICQLTLLVAGSAILPMLVSIKQYPHYLLPSLPFVAIFFAALFVEKVHALTLIKTKLAVAGFAIATVCCWTFTVIKLRNLEHNEMAANAKEIKHYVARASTIGICQNLYHDADIHTYLQRYHSLSLTTKTENAKYVFADANCLSSFDLTKDKVVPLEHHYFLVIKNQRARDHHAVYH
ncbi:glycosyltransferase family 39 protein [Dyadobacter chenwenxiniae]|uniref:Glycosyltransferase family 39 protein n=1 Tax=Dyadobacter chenwenxiniae TaxID=2906456 RepID=A0A9X1PRI7_9BACT|nr:glycosyltransferase family 39 protein [Dyadobacter chenwenxiniae]MCF0065693.1 glycosyltransferase family 39 protein [Dyadobacter chenwenxiniae]UON82064.1 glycosyltransferase family 39 protein [Dyadobacter chenwenxiniae]